MSNLAYARPQRHPRHEERTTEQTRHIEIVTTRAQRKARPRIVYALATVAGLFALVIAQLLLSIVIADGAYEISSLRTEQRDLSRTAQSLGEQLDLLQSPQNLATQAEDLGMVMSASTPMFLRLSDGKVLGSAGAASQGAALLGAKGSLVANALLAGIPENDKGDEPAQGDEPEKGAPSIEQPESNVASAPGTLPSPVTR
jgi:hypothetical protein